MRQLRYSVASSLDGFIAGPDGQFDWIPMDPDIDFAAMYAGFSALVMGRRSYEISTTTEGAPTLPMPTYVYSRTLPEGERNGVTFSRDAVGHVRMLKATGEDKPLWLWGGGELFGELARAGLVDAVDVAILPVLLGDGLPFLKSPYQPMSLTLRSQRLYPKTGTLFLEYDVVR